jgi:hypothetical protein
MTKLIISASLLAVLATTSNAHAQASISRSIEITGTVVTGCTIGEENSAPIAFNTSIVDGEQKANNGFSIERKLGNVTCNYPAFISLRTTKGALKTAAGGACNFETAGAYTYNCVGYEAALAWDGTSAVVDANGDSASVGRVSDNAQAAAPFSGDLILAVTIDSETDKPVADGSYSDTLIVQVGADLL